MLIASSASSFSYSGSSNWAAQKKSSVTFTSYITKGGTCHAALFLLKLSVD
jgi:hypothetical protein